MTECGQRVQYRRAPPAGLDRAAGRGRAGRRLRWRGSASRRRWRLGGLEHPECRARSSASAARRALPVVTGRQSALGVDAAATLIDLLGDGARFEAAEIVTGELADLVGAGLDWEGGGALWRSSISRFGLRGSRCLPPSRRPGVGPRAVPRPPSGSARMRTARSGDARGPPSTGGPPGWYAGRGASGRTSAAPRPGRGGRAGARPLVAARGSGQRHRPARAGRCRCRCRRADRTAGGGRAFRARGSRYSRARRFRGRGAGPDPGRSFWRAGPGRAQAAIGVLPRRPGFTPIWSPASKRASSPLESFISTSSSGDACCGRTPRGSRRARRS